VLVNETPVVWRARALVEKWTDDEVAWVRTKTGDPNPGPDRLRRLIAPEVAESDGNLLTTAGLTRLTALLTAAGGQGMTATSTRLGVGNGVTGAAIGDTDLSASSGSTNRWFMPMNATYPSAAAGVVTVQSTWASADGDFAWNEWGIDIAAPTVVAGATVGACLLNHKSGAALGTKSTGSWTLTGTITIA